MISKHLLQMKQMSQQQQSAPSFNNELSHNKPISYKQQNQDGLIQFNKYLQTQNLAQNQISDRSNPNPENNTPIKQHSFSQKQTNIVTFSGQQQTSSQQRTPSRSGIQNSAATEKIKNSLRIIFMFYSSFGDRQNTTLLKSNKLIKLLSDAQILPNLLTTQDADILYHQQTKHTETLTVDQFQQILPRIAAIAFPDAALQQALLRLYNLHFQGLFDKIMQFTEFGEQIQLINHQITEQFNVVLRIMEPILSRIHSSVFPDQSQKPAKVQWQFLQFLTQFDIIPDLINQSQAQLIFADLFTRSHSQISLECKGKQRYIFPLTKFVESLIIIGLTSPLYVEDEENLAMSQLLSFRGVLQKMETSQGFATFQKTQSRTHSEIMKLVAPFDRAIGNENRTPQKSQFQQSRITQRNTFVRNFSPDPESLLTLDRECLMLFENHMLQLKNIFEHYASLAEPLNVTHLKGFKFNKLLANSNIFNTFQITYSDADIIYVKLTGQGFTQQVKQSRAKYDLGINSPTLQNRNNRLYYSQDKELQNGKMNFSQFLKSIELVAIRCFPNENNLLNSVTQILENHILVLEKSIKKEKQEAVLQILVELLQDDTILQLYSLMQNVFDVYFQCYSQNNQRMDLNAFMRFCLEFELSNCLLSQANLMQIFYALSSLNTFGQQGNTSQTSEIGPKSIRGTNSQFQFTPFIDKHQFVEAISIVAMLVYSQEPNKLIRVIFLLEKMNESQGQIKVQKQYGLTRQRELHTFNHIYNYIFYRNPHGYKWDLVASIYEVFGLQTSQQESPTKRLQQTYAFEDIMEQGLQEQQEEA